MSNLDGIILLAVRLAELLVQLSSDELTLLAEMRTPIAPRWMTVPPDTQLLQHAVIAARVTVEFGCREESGG